MSEPKVTYQVTGVQQSDLEEGQFLMLRVDIISEAKGGDLTVHLTSSPQGRSAQAARRDVAAAESVGRDTMMAQIGLAILDELGTIGMHLGSVDDALRNTVGGVPAGPRSEYH